MDNSYAPPQAQVGDVAGSGGAITQNMIEALRGTKGWVLLMGILLFIGAGFMALTGAMMLIGGAATSEVPGGGAAVAGMGVGYLLFALLYLFPGLYLVRYSSAIGRLLASGQGHDLERALDSQRRFWRFVGVLALVMMGVAVIGILAAIAFPMFAAAR